MQELHRALDQFNELPFDAMDIVRRRLSPHDRQTLADVSSGERKAWYADMEVALRRWDPPPAPPDPPHPLEAGLRNLLRSLTGPDREVVSVALRGRLALTSDGVLWRVGDDDPSTAVEVPVPGLLNQTAVARLWSTEVWDSVDAAQVAVLRLDGALFVAGNLIAGGGPLENPHDFPHLQQPDFKPVDLGGERVVDVFLTPGQGHVLTRSGPLNQERGSLWVWGNAANLLAYPMHATDPALIAPVRVATVGHGDPAPSFSGLSVDVHGQAMCAMDDDGRLYAAGNMFLSSFDEHDDSWWVGLVPLPRAPAPVLQVLAAARSFGAEANVLRTDVLRTNGLRTDGLRTDMRTDGLRTDWLRADGVRTDGHTLWKPVITWPGDGLMALLTDGTLWGLTTQRRMPGVTGVVHMRRTGDSVRLMTWHRRDLPYHPARVQMRAHFGAEIVSTVCQGLYALTRDGKVWRAGAEQPLQVPVPRPLHDTAAGSASVDRLWGPEDRYIHPHLALRRTDGALLVANITHDPRELPTFWEARLDGQLALQVFLTPMAGEWIFDTLAAYPGQLHVLTREGSLWAYGHDPGQKLLGHGADHKQQLVKVTRTILGQLCDYPDLVNLTQLSVEPHGRVLCAVDRQNSLYMCGPMRVWQRPVLSSQPREQVWQVLAMYRGILALLVDGTVWQVERGELVPGVTGVHGLRRDGHTVRLILADGREEPLPSP